MKYNKKISNRNFNNIYVYETFFKNIKIKREITDLGDNVAVLPVDFKNKKIVLCHQLRFGSLYKKFTKYKLLELVAGRKKDNENFLSAAKREFYEETGVIINNPIFLFEALISPGSTNEFCKFYFVEIDYSYFINKKSHSNHDEIINFYIFSFKDIKNNLINDNFKNIWTTSALNYFNNKFL